MLLLTMNPGDEYIQIGDDIKIFYRGTNGPFGGGKQIKLGIDAPKNVKIVRSNAINKYQKDD